MLRPDPFLILFDKMKTLVLGLGNELYGDDGVGIHVVRKMRQDLQARKKILNG